jgi:hypothetical protein
MPSDFVCVMADFAAADCLYDDWELEYAFLLTCHLWFTPYSCALTSAEGLFLNPGPAWKQQFSYDEQGMFQASVCTALDVLPLY